MASDAYVDEMLSQQAGMDADEWGGAEPPATLDDAEPEVDQVKDSAMYDDAVPEVDLLKESAIYDDPSNVNNLGRTAKWVPSESRQANTDRDGNMWAFISRADGPMFSAKCKQQIMVLNYLLATLPHRKRLVRTQNLVPTFDSEDILTGLVERIALTTDEIDLMEGSRDDIGAMRVDAIALDRVCDFRSDYTLLGYIERAVQLGEILVSPVCAKYTLDGAECTIVYWLVMLRTRRNFDFAGHVADTISNQVSLFLFFVFFIITLTCAFSRKRMRRAESARDL
jgi:hypothetical protein